MAKRKRKRTALEERYDRIRWEAKNPDWKHQHRLDIIAVDVADEMI